LSRQMVRRQAGRQAGRLRTCMVRDAASISEE
jgi:hypothetical protein